MILNSLLLEDERFEERHRVLDLLKRRRQFATGKERDLLDDIIGDISSERHLA